MRNAVLSLLIAMVGSPSLAQNPAKERDDKAASPPARRWRMVFGPRDDLPTGALKRLGSVRYHAGISDETQQLAFSNAKTIQTVGEGQIGTCNLDTGACTWESACAGEPIGGGDAPIQPGVALSADGRSAALGSFNPVIAVFDTETGNKVHEFPAKYMASPLALSCDGTLLAYSEVPKGAIRENWDPSEEKSKEFAVVVLELSSKKELLRIKVEPASVSRLLFSQDKQTVVLCQGNRAHLWDIGSRKESKNFESPASFVVTDAAVSPCGATLAMAAARSDATPKGFSSDSVILVWNIASGKLLWRSEEHGYHAAALAFSPDGKRLASGAANFVPESGVLRVWDAISGKSLVKVENKSASFANCLAFDRSGKLLASTGSDHNIHIWDSFSGLEIHPRQGHQGKVSGVTFEWRGRILASTSVVDGTVRLWDVATGRELHVLRGHERPPPDIAFSHDGKFLATSGDHYFIVWDLATGKELRRISVPQPRSGLARYLEGLRFSRDGAILQALGSDVPEQEDFQAVLGDQSKTHTTPLEWAASSGKALASGGPGGAYATIAVSPDGKTAVSRTGSVFDTVSGAELFKLYDEGPSRMGYNPDHVAFSPDGRLLAGQSSSQPHGRMVDNVWEVATGGVVRTVAGDNQARSLAFSPDSRVVAGRSNQLEVVLWDTVTDEVIQRLPDESSSSLAFAPDGKTLASGQDDGTIILWRIDPTRWQHPDADPLTPKQLDAQWLDLASSNAHVGQSAVRSLIESPAEAVAFLRQRMNAEKPADPSKIPQLLADLDSSTFSVREASFGELHRLGDVAEPSLRDFLKKNRSAEVTQRVGALLRDLLRVRSPDALRHLRVIQVVETIGSPDAQTFLKTLAVGAATARDRQEATAALERLSERMLFPAKPPTVSPQELQTARRIIDKALKAHGGAAILARLRAVSGEETGKGYWPTGEPYEYVSKFAYHLPEREWSALRMKGEGGKLLDPSVYARDGDRAWARTGNEKQTVSAEGRQEAQESMYARWIAMLYPLADGTIPVAPLSGSRLGDRTILGVVVRPKHHRPLKLFFDQETGLLVRSERQRDEYNGGEATYETFYEDYRTIDGVKCAMRERILRDGKLAVVNDITQLKRSERLDDKLFVEPP